jgi:hypothetical protein
LLYTGGECNETRTDLFGVLEPVVVCLRAETSATCRRATTGAVAAIDNYYARRADRNKSSADCDQPGTDCDAFDTRANADASRADADAHTPIA